MCRCGTDWLTREFVATNEPCAPNAGVTAAAIRCTAPNSGGTNSAGNSTIVSTCRRGITKVCPLNTGRVSRKASTSGVSRTSSATSVPAAIRQNRQAWISVTGPFSPPSGQADWSGPPPQAMREEAWMAPRIEVTDPADPRLDDFRDLARADRRPDRPGGRGLVIAEGVVVVRRLLVSPYPTRALLGTARRYTELADDLTAHSAPFYVVEPELMAAVVGFHLNRGVLPTADRAGSPPVEPLIAGAQALAVLEGVGDHENLGSIFRSAAALGVDGVLLG